MRSNNHADSTSTRRHLLFPTVGEARENVKLVFSDHLPLLANVNLGEETTSLNILTLNILGPNVSASGFHKYNGWENDEESIERYKKIVMGFVAAIKKHQVDVITLQEATPQFIETTLKELLPNWEILVEADVGLITCINRERFEIKDHQLDDRRRIAAFELLDKKNNIKIKLHNVWGLYDPYPHRMEKHFRDLLASEIPSIIIGDTNSRIAPVDNIPRNIVTGVVPIGLNELYGAGPEQQITDYPDGGFYQLPGGSIKQLETVTLDYETAERLVDSRKLEEINPWNEFRMVLCLDAHYHQTPIINGKTIFQYEKDMAEKVKEPIILRMAADSFNRKAIGIRLSPNSELYNYLSKQLNFPNIQKRKIDTTAPEDNGKPHPTIFVPIEMAELLHKVLVDFIPFQEFKNKYENQYDSEWIKNPNSEMRAILKNDLPETNKIEVVKQYAKNHPKSRTAKVLNKLTEEHTKKYLEDNYVSKITLEEFKQRFLAQYNSESSINIFKNSDIRGRLMTNNISMDQIIQHAKEKPNSRTAKVLRRLEEEKADSMFKSILNNKPE